MTSPRDPNLPWSAHRGTDGTMRMHLPLADLARVLSTREGSTWVDVDVANRHQVALLEHVCGFHPLSIEDALNPNSRVKTEEYAGYVFTIVRGVRFHEATEDPYDLETFNIGFFLGENLLVTTHLGEATPVREVTERVERSPDLLSRGCERLMHAVMDVSVDAYFPILDQIDVFMDGLEQRVFEQFDESALHEIFAVKRLVLSLRRHLAPQREVFNVLTNRPSVHLSPEMQAYFRDVYDHVLRINDGLDTYRELLGSTLDSYLTQVSNRLGNVTKGLSIVATLSIPFVVVSGMWGMNFTRVPLAENPMGFWLMLVLQVGAGVGLVLLLRWRKLL